MNIAHPPLHSEYPLAHTATTALRRPILRINFCGCARTGATPLLPIRSHTCYWKAACGSLGFPVFHPDFLRSFPLSPLSDLLSKKTVLSKSAAQAPIIGGAARPPTPCVLFSISSPACAHSAYIPASACPCLLRYGGMHIRSQHPVRVHASAALR